MELFDLYDDERRLTNETMVRGTPVPEGKYRIAVHLLLFNKQGQLLIQHRQPTKDTWAGYWDVSVGGSVAAGESSWTTIKREAREEIGYAFEPDHKHPAITICWSQGYDDMFVHVTDTPLEKFTVQEEELSEIRWADLDEVLNMISNKTFIPYRKELITLLFALRENPSLHQFEE